MKNSIYRLFIVNFVVAAILLLSLSMPSGALAVGAYQFGGIDTFASVPVDPGFPEGIAVYGSHVYVSGPARFGTAGTGPSAIEVYDRKTGALDSTIYVAGEALAFEHAVSNIAVDGDGRIYALSTQLGVIRFTKVDGIYIQDSYGAPLPDLSTCALRPAIPARRLSSTFRPL